MPKKFFHFLWNFFGTLASIPQTANAEHKKFEGENNNEETFRTCTLLGYGPVYGRLRH